MKDVVTLAVFAAKVLCLMVFVTVLKPDGSIGASFGAPQMPSPAPASSSSSHVSARAANDEPDSSSAPGSPFVAHGTNTAGTARLVSFAMNPLYRADPEREWPMVGAAAYWTDQ